MKAGNFKARMAQMEPGDPLRTQTSARIAQLQRDIETAHQHNSLLGRLGRVIEPAVKPLGWDWRIGCAVIASLPAREIVVATLGVMYNIGGNAELKSETEYAALQTRLRSVTWDGTDKPVYNIPVALSIMVFFALCVQCAAYAGGNPPRNKHLAMAGVYLHLYDSVGVYRRIDNLSSRNVDWVVEIGIGDKGLGISLRTKWQL